MANNIEGRYISPLTDYGFKKVFGEKDILIAFLTDLLNPISPINDIIFLDKEMEADTIDMRKAIYDLRCKTQDGGEFIVEMQNTNQLNFSNRILYYLSHAISSQGKKGTLWNFELHPVYGVFFLNFHLHGLKPQTIRTIQLTIDETGEVFTKNLKAFTLELVDFKNKPKEYAKSRVEYWLYNLVNMDSMTEGLPFQEQQPIFGKVGEILELSHMNSEENQKYFDSLNKYRTYISAMQYQLEEGLKEGRKEGLKEGRKEGRKEGIEIGIEKERKEIAFTMKSLNIPIDTIVKSTGLSAEQIEKL